MNRAEFEKVKVKVKGRMSSKVNKITLLANKGNSLCQKIIQAYQRWMFSMDEGDMSILCRYLDEFDQVEKEGKL